ncbi:MAG TPA: L-type lectin family protein [Symbiobacteriaceae bacterium]|nr:L-type lectin family protein [Symbiobacteriaceae bacterium]
MTTWIRLRCIAASLLAALLVTLGTVRPGVAASTTVTFSDFSDLSSMVLSGSTAAVANPVSFGGQNVLRLSNALSQAGGAFLADPIPLIDSGGFHASFSTAFQFQITHPMGCGEFDAQGADGLVFVVQTASNQYGGAGGGLGYDGIDKSIGIEFDTWYNGGVDPNGNHVGIDQNGSVASLATANVSPAMNNGQVWYAWIDYDGNTQNLEVRLSQNSARPAAPLLARNMDLPAILEQPDAYVGFTAGTGCGGNDHDIRSWTFTNTYNPIDDCPVGLTWDAPLNGAGAYNMVNGSTLPAAFKYCDANGFVHDESVLILVQDRANPAMPVTVWVYGSDIAIDDAQKKYSENFNSALYALSPGAVLDMNVFIGDTLAGTKEIHITP